MLLNIVIPCYNEEAVLPETNRQLTEVVNEWISRGLLDDCRIVYVDDGSKDGTWKLIEALQKGSPRVHGLKLAHNAGHQHALWAGLMNAVGRCDAVVSMDADLQHDIHSIAEMVAAYQDGCEVVYGVRNDRTADSAFKKKTAPISGFWVPRPWKRWHSIRRETCSCAGWSVPWVSRSGSSVSIVMTALPVSPNIRFGRWSISPWTGSPPFPSGRCG